MPLFDPADFRLPQGLSHVCAGGETAFLEAVLGRLDFSDKPDKP